MIFSLGRHGLGLAMTLINASVEIVETEGEEAELIFSDLRKKTVGEVFDVSFLNDKLIVKEKIRRKLPISTALFDESLNTDLTLKIPEKTSLSGTLSTVSGNIKVPTLCFDGKIKTINGNMNLGDVKSNNLHLHSVNGNVKVANMDGSLWIKTISGRSVVENGFIKELSLNSVSGDMQITAGFEPKDDCSISTVSGDISLKVLSYAGNRNMYLSTLSGKTVIDGAYPQEKIQIKKRMPFLKNFPFKSIKPMMKDIMSSFSSMKDNFGVEVHTSTDDGNSKNVEMILNMLSEGKITAEDAEKLIAALKGES